MKDKEIIKLLKANWKTHTIAAYLQIPIRQVYKIKKENGFKDFYYGRSLK